MTATAIVGLLVVLAACGAAMPPVPGKGGPAWIELTSEHFTLWTDAAQDRAHELMRKMEHLRQVVVGVAFPGVPSNGRNLVIALRDDDELSAFSPTNEPRAFAAPAQAPLWQPMIVLSANNKDARGEVTVAHELTHLISYAVIHHQPRWFAEGIADFFETVGLDPDSTKVDVGVAPTHRGPPMRIGELVPIPTLFAWKTGTTDDHELYQTAWALFTFLLNEHHTELVRYMRLLDGADVPSSLLSAEQAEGVWVEAFPSLPITAISGALRQWLTHGRHVVLHANVQPREWRVTERALGDADVYALRGLLRATVANQEAQALQDLDAALAAEPTNVLARVLTVVLDHAKITPEDGRALTGAHEDDWRAWLLATIALSNAHGDEAEVQAARGRACELIAANPALSPPVALCLQVTGQRSP